MGPTVTMYIPAFLRYDLRETNGEWLIGALRAYWELPAMMVQFLRSGGRGAPLPWTCAAGCCAIRDGGAARASWPDSAAWARRTNGWCGASSTPSQPATSSPLRRRCHQRRQ